MTPASAAAGTDTVLPDEEAPIRPGERVLVSRLRYLGDVILSLPLLTALRRALPECELHYLAEAGPLELLASQPELDRCWEARHGAGRTLGLARRLRAQHFAAVIDLFCNPRSALLVRASGARIRVGEDRRVRRHAYTVARRLIPGRSALEQHLDAMRGLGLQVPPPERPVLHLTAAELDAGAMRWRHLAAEPRVVVHVAATQLAKEWPVAHATSLVRLLAARGFAVALTSAPHRPATSAAVADAAGGAATLLPVLPLRELLAVLAGATAVVSVDGAVAHASVALGRPTVALFGPTDPHIWFPYANFGPYRVLHAGVDCGSCDRVVCPEHRCMAALSPDEVESAVHAVLSGTRS
jgi:ADP-heptose:LPS heptosyltransferase